MTPLDPIWARNNLIEAAAHILIEIGKNPRAGSRRERWLLGTLAPALAKVDAACGEKAIGRDVPHD